MADVPDGQHRPDARPDASLSPLRAGKDSVRHRPLQQRGEAPHGVLDTRLKESEYVAADEYTIADIAIFPWLRSWQNQGIDWADFPHAKAWFDRVAARPAVQRGVEVLAGLRKPLRDDKAREVLFGAQQYRRH